jgi:hypothetical protein
MARPFGTKYIKDPQQLWELFLAYEIEVKSTPRIKVEYVGKDGMRVDTPLECPLTMEGFECFVMDNTEMTYPDLSNYFEGKNESYADYFPISARIKKKIRKDQIEGGVVGLYNASLTARINNLKESTENTNINTNISILNIDPLDDSTDHNTT